MELVKTDQVMPIPSRFLGGAGIGLGGLDAFGTD